MSPKLAAYDKMMKILETLVKTVEATEKFFQRQIILYQTHHLDFSKIPINWEFAFDRKKSQIPINWHTERQQLAEELIDEILEVFRSRSRDWRIKQNIKVDHVIRKTSIFRDYVIKSLE